MMRASVESVTKTLWTVICYGVVGAGMAVAGELNLLAPVDRAGGVKNDPQAEQLVREEFYPEGLQGEEIYSIAQDLNQDGKKEIIVQLGQGYCGTAGCLTLIYTEIDGKWGAVFGDNVNGLKILPTQSKGWSDLGQFTAETDTPAPWRFNGEIYEPAP